MSTEDTATDEEACATEAREGGGVGVALPWTHQRGYHFADNWILNLELLRL